MDRLEKAWARFKGWPWLAQRDVIAAALYLLWLLSVWIYSEGLHDGAEVLGVVSSIGFFFAIGGWYILRGALFILAWWLRLF
ncbi:hypothetical protein P5W98_03375 [Paraburkholderia sp. A1BS-2L]|uniref:hypothetical protein n=1 Tax=Paraburkholderia sp. A1BS-2L TaxID=3028373 RepID=UPI003DA91190